MLSVSPWSFLFPALLPDIWHQFWDSMGSIPCIFFFWCDTKPGPKPGALISLFLGPSAPTRSLSAQVTHWEIRQAVCGSSKLEACLARFELPTAGHTNGLQRIWMSKASGFESPGCVTSRVMVSEPQERRNVHGCWPTPQPNKDLLDISGWFCIRNSQITPREGIRGIQKPAISTSEGPKQDR